MRARSIRSEKVSIRRQVSREHDPYLASFYGETVACKVCGAVHHKKRWYLPDDWERSFPNVVAMRTIECPACRKRREHFPGGVVTLRGDFFSQHHEEIGNSIRNEERRAMGFNPLERIIDWKEKETVLVITTTTEKLAQRIGRSVSRAFSGSVEYRMSKDEKLMRVYWSR